MPTLTANKIKLHYEEQGTGEPLILIPYLSADCACYAFQVAEFAKHFRCISVDMRGTGESDKPGGVYSTELLADDVAALIQEMGVESAHVFGMSLGGAVGMWLGAKYPERVRSLSLHSTWAKSDLFLQTVVESWQVAARALSNVPEMVVRCIFPWCFTPELYASRPEYIESLAQFVRSRPPQPLQSFLQHSNAVIAHDAGGHLPKIKAPTQITFGRCDLVTSTRFADELTKGIRGSELLIFEDVSHAPVYECVEEFNQKTLAFLNSVSGASAAARARHFSGAA